MSRGTRGDRAAPPPPTAAARVLVAALILVLGGCGGQTSPADSTPGPTDQPTPRPPASVAASPSAAPDPATAALDAFVAFATSPKTSYQGTFTGHQRATVTIVNITKGVLEVSGSDVLVRATFTFPQGDSSTVEHRYVGGTAWIRLSPKPWGRLAPFPPALSMGAFALVHSAADVTALGPVSVKGKTLYKIRIPSTIVNPVMVPATNLTDRAVTASQLELLIDAAGHPVSGEAEITGQGRVSGQLQEIAIDLAVSFTKIGKPVSISSP